MALADHLIREGIASLHETRIAAAAELAAGGMPPGQIRGVLFAIDREIERLEEAVAILLAAEDPPALIVPADHPFLPGFH